MVSTPSEYEEIKRMKSKSEPKVVELDAEQLEAKLNQIERVMGEETARPFRLLLRWYLALLRLIEEKNTSLNRLRRLLFGARTERTRDVVPTEPTPADPADDQADEPRQPPPGGE